MPESSGAEASDGGDGGDGGGSGGPESRDDSYDDVHKFRWEEGDA